MRSSSPAAPPTGTYRLQINTGFTFAQAAQLCSYLAQLGVSHLFLSPILQAVQGSAHGYDVIDHTTLSADAGGREAFGQLVASAHAHGLKVIADVVPNHMAVPVPENLSAPLWSVLRDGTDSPYARWFDVDWSSGQLIMPVLGTPIGDVVAEGQLTVDAAGPEPVLRYYDHMFPLRAGTAHLPMPELLAAQHYRLAWWRIGNEELNYRRFFDVTTLAGIRVEDAEVFDVSHALLADLVADGSLDGLRVDHPDGLADPREYLRRLSAATSHTWVVVEKILEGDEALPADWHCAGTTGYDALNVVGGLFVDPDGRAPLDALAERKGADAGGDLPAATRSAKLQIAGDGLSAEVVRLLTLLERIRFTDLRLRDLTRNALHRALTALLVSIDRYRAYAVPGEPVPAETVGVIDAAAEQARRWLTGDEMTTAALRAVQRLVLDTMSGDPVRDEFVVRFQQTCGPVMAKGVEDTLFYRWNRLIALNEVGADPARFGHSPSDFHAFAQRIQRDWPTTMTTLSTHDTKRSEDARARLIAISEVPQEWAAAVDAWEMLATRHLPAPDWPDAAVRYLIWQTLIAIWDGVPEPGRLATYLLKAGREAKLWTTWTSPAAALEQQVESFARAVLADSGITAAIGSFVQRLDLADRANVLGQKLIQLTMPGVPDVYQGCEIVDRSLVDPDNRRPVDYDRRTKLLDELAAQNAPNRQDGSRSLDAHKLLVTSRALQLRREHPDWFGTTATYLPVPTSTHHAVAFARGTSAQPEVITIATRLALRLAAGGGWGHRTAELPGGSWIDRLTGREMPGGTTGLASLLADLPVALLVRVAS